MTAGGDRKSLLEEQYREILRRSGGREKIDSDNESWDEYQNLDQPSPYEIVDTVTTGDAFGDVDKREGPNQDR